MNDASLMALGQRLQQRGQWLAVAESCTGGLIAAQITDISGASAWFDRGVVTYSNRAKAELLGVPAALLDAHGAVSGQVASAMAAGLRARAAVDWTVRHRHCRAGRRHARQAGRHGMDCLGRRGRNGRGRALPVRR